MISYFLDKDSSNVWLIDSGCIEYMTNDAKLFKKLNKLKISKVRVGNGEFS